MSSGGGPGSGLPTLVKPQKPPPPPSRAGSGGVGRGDSAGASIAPPAPAAAPAPAASNAEDTKSAWAAGDFEKARMEMAFLDEEQRRRQEEEGMATLCHGEKLRLLLLVRRPEGGPSSSPSKELFQRNWELHAAGMQVEARLHLAEALAGPDGQQRLPTLHRAIMVKGCSLTRLGAAAGADTEAAAASAAALAALSDSERRMVEGHLAGPADLCYLVETDVEIKLRYLDRRLNLSLHVSLQEWTTKHTAAAAASFEARASSISAEGGSGRGGSSADGTLRQLLGLTLAPTCSAAPRILQCTIRVVEPLLVTSSYASHQDGSYINVQIENRHPLQALVIQDVGFHLDHSVRCASSSSSGAGHVAFDEAAGGGGSNPYQVPASFFSQPQAQPRFEKTVGYHPFTPQHLHDEAFVQGHKGAAAGAAASSALKKGGGGPHSPSKAKAGGYRYLNNPASLHRIIAGTPTTPSPPPQQPKRPQVVIQSPASSAAPAPDKASGDTTPPRPPLFSGAVSNTPAGATPADANNPPAAPASAAPVPPPPPIDTSAPPAAAVGPSTPTNKGQNAFLASLSAHFRLNWVENVAFPLVIQPGFRHGLVFHVEPHGTTATTNTTAGGSSSGGIARQSSSLLAAAQQAQPHTSTRPASQQPSQPPQLLRGPFWTPLTVAWRMRHEHQEQGQQEQKEEEATAAAASSQTFFTDKLLAWDASTALAQDFALAMHVDEASSSLRLNRISAVTITVVNLTDQPADLVLKVQDKVPPSHHPHQQHPHHRHRPWAARDSGEAAQLQHRRSSSAATARTAASLSMSASASSALSASAGGGRTTPSAGGRRLRTFMEGPGSGAAAGGGGGGSRRLSASGGAEAAEGGEGQEEAALAAAAVCDDAEYQEGADEEEDEDGDEEEEEEWEDGDGSYSRRFEEWQGPGGGVRRERCSDSNVTILNTAIPVGTLQSLDESTIQLHLLPLRPGLCRLSTLLLENRSNGRLYRLERPLELYVRDGASPQ